MKSHAVSPETMNDEQATILTPEHWPRDELHTNSVKAIELGKLLLRHCKMQHNARLVSQKSYTHPE